MTTITGTLFDDKTVQLVPETLGMGGAWQPDGTAWDGDLLRIVYEYLLTLEPPIEMLDIGASTGSYCRLVEFVPGMHVWACEPDGWWDAREIDFEVRDRMPYRVLGENVSANLLGRRISPCMFAMGDKRGPSIMYMPKQTGLSTIGEPQRFDRDDAVAIPVYVQTIDFLFRSTEHIKFIKIDTEGAELPILRGGEQTILRHKPTMLVEYDDRNTAQFGYAASEITDWLEARGATWCVVGPRKQDIWVWWD